MNVGGWINRNPVLATAGAVVLLLAASAVLYYQAFGLPFGGSPAGVYYKDLESGELFVEAAAPVPAITAPSGGVGARAHLYTCGECRPEEWFGYLEALTAEGRRLQEEQGHLPDEEYYIVRELDADQWTPYMSMEGTRLTNETRDSCPDGDDTVPERCLP